MDNKKGLKMTLDSVRDREKYDNEAKKLFCRKEILAPLLKFVVSEYEACTAEEIMNLIEGDTMKVGTEAVSPDMANTIRGENAESSASGEAGSRFDVLFRSLLPDSKSGISVNLHIDVEIQKNGEPGYNIVNRAIYYCSRLICSQLLKVGEKETGYGSLEKVYSIFICLEGNHKDEQNSIAYYKITNYKTENIGRKEDGDLMEIVIIRLGKKDPSKEGILEMLSGIFSGNREKTFKYLPNTSEEEAEEVEDMLNIVEYAEERGIVKGKAEGKAEGMVLSAKIFRLVAENPGRTNKWYARKCNCSVEEIEQVRKAFDI